MYTRARQLCDRLETTPELSQVLWGLWTFHALKAELSTALDIAGEFLRLTERVADPGVAMRGHWTMEITCTHQGKFVLALEHFEKALTLYERDQDRGDAFPDALNPGVALRCFAAWSHWFVGRPDRALVLIQEAVALARRLSEPHGLAHALVFAAILHQLRRERTAAREHADAALDLSEEHGLVLYQAMAHILRGWTRVSRSDQEGAADQMRQGLGAWQSTGARLMLPHFLALLADALEPAPADEGLRVLDEALVLAESTGERCYQAELHRLKGERLLARALESGSVEAEACFEQSLAIARQQGARSLELRTALSLARLYRDRGRHVEACNLVLPIYERFDEGFDTLDLREARDLLDLYAER